MILWEFLDVFHKLCTIWWLCCFCSASDNFCEWHLFLLKSFSASLWAPVFCSGFWFVLFNKQIFFKFKMFFKYDIDVENIHFTFHKLRWRIWHSTKSFAIMCYPVITMSIGSVSIGKDFCIQSQCDLLAINQNHIPSQSPQHRSVGNETWKRLLLTC